MSNRHMRKRRERAIARRRARRERSGHTTAIPGMPIAPVSRQYPHKRGDLFTPWTPQVLEWIEELKAMHGTWDAVCDEVRVSSRWMRALRKGKYKTISMTSLDKVLARGGSAHRVEELEWYSFDQLLEKGIWKPMPDLNGGYSRWLMEVKEFEQLPKLKETG